jgi:hypothetical protein
MNMGDLLGKFKMEELRPLCYEIVKELPTYIKKFNLDESKNKYLDVSMIASALMKLNYTDEVFHELICANIIPIIDHTNNE